MAWLASYKISWYCVDHHLQLSCPQTPSISCCPQISGQPSANCLIFRQAVPVANVSLYLTSPSLFHLSIPALLPAQHKILVIKEQRRNGSCPHDMCSVPEPPSFQDSYI